MSNDTMRMGVVTKIWLVACDHCVFEVQCDQPQNSQRTVKANEAAYALQTVIYRSWNSLLMSIDAMRMDVVKGVCLVVCNHCSVEVH